MQHINLTIADNGTESTSYDFSQNADPAIRRSPTIVGVITPATVGTKLTAQASLDGSTWYGITDYGTTPFEIGTGATALWHETRPYQLYSMKHIRFVSDASETGGPLTITLIVDASR
jgi:hypothetical protein